VLNAIDGDLTNIESKIDTIDTNVDAVLLDTGTTLPAQITSIETSINTNVDAAETAILAAIAALVIPTLDSIVDGVWDEGLTDHETAGTFGMFARDVLSGTIGKAMYDESVSRLLLYRWDNDTTLLYSFDAKDVDGNAAGTNPLFEKVPV
jgi:hypothetical protein